VVGGDSGSRPASAKAALFQYKTGVERWNGMPQICPSNWLLSRNAGKNASMYPGCCAM
jgi:hypothetical protein